MPSLSIIFLAEYISQAHFSCEYIGLASTMKKWHPFQSTVMAKAQPKLSFRPLPRNWEQVHSSERMELTLCKKLENAGDLAGTHSRPPCTCSEMNKVPNDTQLMKHRTVCETFACPCRHPPLNEAELCHFFQVEHFVHPQPVVVLAEGLNQSLRQRQTFWSRQHILGHQLILCVCPCGESGTETKSK